MMRGRPRKGRWRVVSAVATRGFILGAAMLLGACTVGPDYVRPTVEVPTAVQGSRRLEGRRRQRTRRSAATGGSASAIPG